MGPRGAREMAGAVGLGWRGSAGVEELEERGEGFVADVVFDAFGVTFSGFAADPEGAEEGGDGFVAGFAVACEGGSGFGEEDGAVGFGADEALALESGDGAADGDVGDAEGSGEVDDAGFAGEGDEVGDGFDVVFGDFAGVVLACFGETAGLGRGAAGGGRLGWLGGGSGAADGGHGWWDSEFRIATCNAGMVS